MIQLRSDCRETRVLPDPRLLAFQIDNFRAALGDAPRVPDLTWSGGFYPLEQEGGRTWHWSSSSGDLLIRNPGPATETALSMILATSHPDPAPLTISGPGFGESLTIGPAGTVFSKRFLTPQGDSVIRFSSPAAPMFAPPDPRKLVFRVEDLQYGDPLLSPHLIQAN